MDRIKSQTYAKYANFRPRRKRHNRVNRHPIDPADPVKTSTVLGQSPSLHLPSL